jgi:hypothetical protein
LLSIFGFTNSRSTLGSTSGGSNSGSGRLYLLFLFRLELDLVLLNLVQVLEQASLIAHIFDLINKSHIFENHPFTGVSESANSIESLGSLALMFKRSSYD